jgi:hypothetical protein
MRPTRLVALPLLALLVAGCGASGAPPSVAPTPTAPPPTPVGASPAPSDGCPDTSSCAASPSDVPSAGAPAQGLGYWLRMTTSQAIPPIQQFQVGPTSLITSDGLYLVPGAIPMIYPGPLVGPIFSRQVTDAGRDQIVGWAKELGLLDGKTDFTGNAMVPGGVAGRIELTVDGSLVTLAGVPDLPSNGSAAPGSPEAFSELWRRVSSLPETLPGELGPEQPYEPIGYGLLVGPPPRPEAGIKGNLQDWPLATPIATFGQPVANGSVRCGTAFGADAADLGQSFENANQLSQWVQDPDTSATFGLTVRPIVPGEDPCKELFGV